MNLFVMCTKTQCPKASECFRLRASPDLPDQLYNDFISLCNDTDGYRYFMRILEKDNIVELNEDIKALEIIEATTDEGDNNEQPNE